MTHMTHISDPELKPRFRIHWLLQIKISVWMFDSPQLLTK